MLREGPIQSINDSTGVTEKTISKAITKCCLSLHYKGYESYLYVNKTEIYKFKFWFGSVSKGFTKDEQSETSLNVTVYDFLVEYNFI